MKLYQLVSHINGNRTPILQAESLADIAKRIDDALKHLKPDERKALEDPLEDYILVIGDWDSDKEFQFSSQPLMRVSTVLELCAQGKSEPVSVSTTVVE